MDAQNNWPVETVDGEQLKRSPGRLGLSGRLKRLWEFIRLQLHMHFEDQSGIAAHCTRLHLGSLAEPRFNEACTHKHPSPSVPARVPEVRVSQSKSYIKHASVRGIIGNFLGVQSRIVLSSTCTQHRKDWSQQKWPESIWYGAQYPSECKQKGDVCSHAGCEKRPSCHCTHCTTSFCRPHCAEAVCSSENLPAGATAFVCKQCAPKLDACTHSNLGCATCDEIQYFKQDLMHCAHATNQGDIIGRAKDVCKSIDVMVGHTARTSNQERYWPDMLDKLKKELDYESVLLKSDYWKKFEGTVMKQGLLRNNTHSCNTHTHTHNPNVEKCKSAPKQSIETHSAWYLIPPADKAGVNWDLFPEDIKFALPDEQGFRGFIVEFFNIISGTWVEMHVIAYNIPIRGDTHARTYRRDCSRWIPIRTEPADSFKDDKRKTPPHQVLFA